MPKIPDWLKLDNAATIYPSTLSKKYAAMFRLTITLNDKVDENILEEAVNNIIDRFPTFRFKLKQGLFWCYFKRIKNKVLVENDYNNPMLRINFKNSNNYMFRVRYYENRIAVEFFHALTDGNGGIKFISTLAGEYIRLKYHKKIIYNNLVLNPNEKVKRYEYSDDFYKYARKIGKLEKEKEAYHYKGTLENSNILNIITGIVPIDKLKEECHKYNCSMTCFLASLLILSIQELKGKSKDTKPIKISIPVNLRNYYESSTIRNFSSYVNVGIEPIYGIYTFEEIIKIVKCKMELGLTEKKLNAKFSANVKLTKNIFIRLTPMFIKKRIMSLSDKMMGDRYCTHTLSNLGYIELPKNVSTYVEEVGFIIGKSRFKPGSCSCIGYKDNVYITFSRKIKETELERIFFTKLVEMNIPVLIESNRR